MRYYRFTSFPVIDLFNCDNISNEVSTHITNNIKKDVDVIYADCIYENTDLSWVYKYYPLLKDGGLFIVQTDYHTVFKYGSLFESIRGCTFVNHIVWKNEWGNHPKNRMHQCFDDILVYCKGNFWDFYPDEIQVPKATASTKLNPSGRQTKTATAFWSDICLTTTSKERVKGKDGKLIRWQKPLALYDRLFSAYTKRLDFIVDPFMGSGTCAVWCKNNMRNYVGVENDSDVYDLAKERLVYNVI